MWLGYKSSLASLQSIQAMSIGNVAQTNDMA